MRRALSSAAGVALVLVVFTGCGTTPTSDDNPPATVSPMPSKPIGERSDPPPLPAGATGIPRPGLPDPKTIDGKDAGTVGRAALTAMWTIDTVLDVSQHDATLRSIPYVTDAYAEQLRATPQRSAPGATWGQWAARKAYTTVKLEAADEAGKPPDTETDAYRTWIVTATPHGEDEWTGEPVITTAFVHLTRTSAQQSWKVATVKSM